MTGFLAYQLKGAEQLAKTGHRAKPRGRGGRQGTAAGKPARPPPAAKKLESLLKLDALQIELGYRLVSLADTRKGGDLLERVTGVRKTFAQDMGVIIPPIRLRDNLQLEPNQYRFLLKGNPVAQGELMPDHWLAMNASNSKTVLKGVPTVEPVFKLPATWVTDVGAQERRNQRVHRGGRRRPCWSRIFRKPSSAIATNILSRQDVQNLLDNLKQTHPTVVTELIPGPTQRRPGAAHIAKPVGRGHFHPQPRGHSGKSQRLRRHHQKPRRTFRARAARAGIANRQALPGGQRQFAGHHTGSAPGATDCPGRAADADGNQPDDGAETGPPRGGHSFAEIQQLLTAGQQPIIMCAPQIRLAFRRFFETTFADLTVLSYAEVPSRVQIQNAGIVPLTRLIDS